MSDTMRERLARAASKATEGELNDAGARIAVDAILRELMEPSEGMLVAAEDQWDGPSVYTCREVWQDMLQHILNERETEPAE